jgi:hypothetical protein
LYERGYRSRLARQWDIGAAFMALFANANSGKGKSFRPEDFHPLLDVNSERDNAVTTAKEREELFARLKQF